MSAVTVLSNEAQARAEVAKTAQISGERLQRMDTAVSCLEKHFSGVDETPREKGVRSVTLLSHSFTPSARASFQGIPPARTPGSPTVSTPALSGLPRPAMLSAPDRTRTHSPTVARCTSPRTSSPMVAHSWSSQAGSLSVGAGFPAGCSRNISPVKARHPTPTTHHTRSSGSLSACHPAPLLSRQASVGVAPRAQTPVRSAVGMPSTPSAPIMHDYSYSTMSNGTPAQPQGHVMQRLTSPVQSASTGCIVPPRVAVACIPTGRASMPSRGQGVMTSCYQAPMMSRRAPLGASMVDCRGAMSPTRSSSSVVDCRGSVSPRRTSSLSLPHGHVHVGATADRHLCVPSESSETDRGGRMFGDSMSSSTSKAADEGTVVWLPGSGRVGSNPAVSRLSPRQDPLALSKGCSREVLRSASSTFPQQHTPERARPFPTQVPTGMQRLGTQDTSERPRPMHTHELTVLQRLSKLNAGVSSPSTRDSLTSHPDAAGSHRSLLSTALANLASSSQLGESEPDDIDAAIPCHSGLVNPPATTTTQEGNSSQAHSVIVDPAPFEHNFHKDLVVEGKPVTFSEMTQFERPRGSDQQALDAHWERLALAAQDTTLSGTDILAMWEDSMSTADLSVLPGRMNGIVQAACASADAQVAPLTPDVQEPNHLSEEFCGGSQIIVPPYASSGSSSHSAVTPRESTEIIEDTQEVEEAHTKFTQAIGKAVELLAEKRGLDYVAKTLVAELDVLSAEEARDDARQDVGKAASSQPSTRPRRWPSTGPRPREALRLRHLRKPGSLIWSTGQLAQQIACKFKDLCEPSSQRMDERNFTKLCKDCRFFDRRFTSVDANLIFKKVLAGSGQRRIDLSQFELALQLVAEKLGLEADDVLAVLLETSAALGETALLSSAEVTRAELARHMGVPTS